MSYRITRDTHNFTVEESYLSKKHDEERWRSVAYLPTISSAARWIADRDVGEGPWASAAEVITSVREAASRIAEAHATT